MNSCTAVTKSGISCKNKAKYGNVCGVHNKVATVEGKVMAVENKNKPLIVEIKVNSELATSTKVLSLNYQKLNLDVVFQNSDATFALLKGKFAETQLAVDAFKSINSQMLINPPILTPYGKLGKQNRAIAFISDESKGYNYSNQLMPSIGLDSENRKLLDYVNSYLRSNYNGILWNKYLPETDYLGAHSDDEKSLGSTGVFSITLWFDQDLNVVPDVSKPFRIHNKKNEIELVFGSEIKKFGPETTVVDVELQHGDVALMFGTFQKHLKHSIPLRKKIKFTRVSATFRTHLE